MDILEIAIKAAGGTGRLAYMLDLKQNVVSNWRQRGVPKGWQRVLEMKFKKQIAEAQKLS
jgi:hypothetical protein